MKNETLQEAVNAFKNGDQSAFQKVYDNSYRYIYYTVLKSVHDKDIADDILQETYIEIYKNISSLKEAEAFKGWAAVIAQNKISRYFRKKSDSLFSSEEEMGATIDSMEEEDTAMLPEDSADNKETQRLIMNIIDSLPDGQREAIVSFYYNQMSIAEIAKALEVSDNTVKTWLSRGKKKIKQEVVDLAEKHGTKLYAVPFMVILSGMFIAEAEACEMPATAYSAISAKLSAETASTVSAGAGSSAQTVIGTVGKAAAATSKSVAASHWGLFAAIGASIVVAGAGAAVGVSVAASHNASEAVVSTAETIETSEAYADIANEIEEMTELSQEATEEQEAEIAEETEEASTEEVFTEESEDDDKYEIPKVISDLQVRSEYGYDYLGIGDYYLFEIRSSERIVDRGAYYEIADAGFWFEDKDETDTEAPRTSLGYDPVTVRIRKNAEVQTDPYGETKSTTAEEYFKSQGTFVPAGYGDLTLETYGGWQTEFDNEGYITRMSIYAAG